MTNSGLTHTVDVETVLMLNETLKSKSKTETSSFQFETETETFPDFPETETETFQKYVSRPSRDRDFKTEITIIPG